KSMITTVIALTLFGCGGGEGGSGGGTTVVKNYTIDFLGTDILNSTDGCQIFGYVERVNGQREEVIAFRAPPPTSWYEVFIHNADGSVRQHLKGSDLNSSQLQFRQNEVPNDGYLSFAYFRNTGGKNTLDVTTFEKAVLPDSFSIETHIDRRNDPCLGPSSANPQIKKIKGYIERLPAVPLLSGFNTPYQNLDDITEFYQLNNPDTNPIEFHSQQRPLLAINYATDTDGETIKSLLGFKFTPFTERGIAQSPIKLEPVDWDDSTWLEPDNWSIDNAFLFVNGKKLLTSANYAYLWQPLVQAGETINNQFSYSTSIGDDNYYLYLQGQQNANGHTHYWGIQNVAQGTTDGGGSINTNIQLDQNQIPQAKAPQLGTCTTDTSRQCLRINTGDLSSNTGIQRAALSAEPIGAQTKYFIKQVFYTTIQDELPILSFNRTELDAGLDNNSVKAVISLLISGSQEAKEAFLYQHQTFESDRLSELEIDYIPLLKNIAAQQDFQDKLKRHPYTWVWLKTDNN
ncbi:hypothetical protein, partial [Vibrio sp.]|uniref:hypothetical protein n=1 Tax=Vibrio sp. TaxID=678 RepID=UPI003D0A900A